MDFESPDVEKDFPGLYASQSAKKNQERDSDYSDDDKGFKKDLLIGKRKEKKESKKDKGYVAFEGESSEGEMDETLSPGKVKKSKGSFKFPLKDKKEKNAKSKEKDAKEVKREDETKEGRKDKDKDKEGKDGKKKGRGKIGKLRGKSRKHGQPDQSSTEEKPVFGVPLSVAVERSKCQDGIELPTVVRECIDYIEENGLACEGIYRLSGVKSKVQQLKACYNRGQRVFLYNHEPHVVASLLKQFLRELPEPVLTTELTPKFEEAADIKNDRKRVEALQDLIRNLPTANGLLLSWIFVHMLHVVKLEKKNKMSLQNMSIVLSPTMQISHRVLQALLCHSDDLFRGVEIKKYVPIQPDVSRLSLELPDTPAAIEEELGKQENFLNELHAELNAGLRDQQKEEQLWEVQRIITQLKRKLRCLKQVQTSTKTIQAEDSSHRVTGDDFRIDTTLQQPKLDAVIPRESTEPEKLAEDATTVVIKGLPAAGPTEDQCQPKQEQLPSLSEQLSPKGEERAAVVTEEVVEEEPGVSVRTDSIAETKAVVHQEFSEVGPVTTENTTVESSVAHTNSAEIPVVSPSEIPPASDSQKEPLEDKEILELLQTEHALLLRQEELLLLQEELRGKIKTERSEVERLKVEIADYQQLYKYKQYSFDSSENSSSETESSSDTDEGEYDLQQILEDLIRENQQLEVSNMELSRHIQQEREACSEIKVQMKLLQQGSRPLVA